MLPFLPDQDYFRAIEERNQQNRKPQITPKEILKLSQTNIFINAAIKNWENGGMTWDETMMMLVKTLAEQNEQLKENVVLKMRDFTIKGEPK